MTSATSCARLAPNNNNSVTLCIAFPSLAWRRRWRIADPIRVNPGSCTAITLRPAISRWRFSRLTCVDFPHASMPSNVTKTPVISRADSRAFRETQPRTKNFRCAPRLVCRLAYNDDVAAGQLAVFQGASEAPISELIRVERATRKNQPTGHAQRVALKMGRRLRCSSVTYRFRYAPSNCQSGSNRLAGGPF